MTLDENLHLSEDQLVLAVVDERDLPSSSREHFDICSQCCAEKFRLEQDLMRICRLAEQYSPLPKQRILIPVPEPRGVFRWYRYRRAVLGMALSVAIVVVFVWRFGNLSITPETRLEIRPLEIQETEKLMIEVRMLAENALPAVYMEIIGEPNTEESCSSDFDEEFMQLLIPSKNEGPLSGSDSGTKGDRLC